MVCFRSCFTPFKSRKRRQYLSAVSSPPSKHPFVSLPTSPHYGHGGALEPISEEPTNHVIASESKEKKKQMAEEEKEKEEQLSCNVVKEVTFDCKVETHDGKIQEQPNGSSKSEAPNCSNKEVEDDGLLVSTDVADEGSYEDSEGGYGTVMEESSESLFSISISSRKYQADPADEKEVTSPLPKCVSSDNSKNVTELNPLKKTQLKETTQQYEDKENVKADINVISCCSPEFSFKPLKDNSEQGANNLKKLAVDASLSNWLVGSGGDREPQQEENSVESVGYSTERRQDRPVLGALTIGVLKQVPANRTSPSKSRSQRLISGGTVGSYWMQTGCNAD